jgi:hypothetical protein
VPGASKKILLLAYKFPPYEGVGARRWAKFSKYFSEKNIKLHVITNTWKKNKGRSWINDISNKPNVIINQFSTPFEKFSFRNSFLNKVVNKIRLTLADYFVWTDESAYFYSYNRNKIIKYITSNKIDVIIATGGPFSTNYFASTIKKQFPAIKIIQDFRDLWTEEYFYEFPMRTKEGKFYKKEIELEKSGLENCDYIVSVTPGYIDRIAKKVNSLGIKNKKFILIENGFDPSEIKHFEPGQYPSKAFDKSNINISHFGTAGFGREEEFYKFLISVEKILLGSDKNLQFHFFGHFGEKFKNKILASELSGFVKFYDFLPPDEVQLYMFFSDLHLVINDAVWYYAYGSKVYDAFMYHKPVLLISKEEGLYSLITKNNIGLATNNTNEQNINSLNTIFANIEGVCKNEFFNKNYAYDNHSIERLTEKYIEIINE